MSGAWELPTPDDLHDAKPEWLFRLLDKISETQKLATLMIIWRIWYARNEITHKKPPVPIEASRRFLSSYITSLLAIKHHPDADHVKGKQVIVAANYVPQTIHEITLKPRWDAPNVAHAKLNIDGVFVKEDGSAGAGMILRDHEGAVIFVATRVLFNCADALEAEMAAMDKGLRLALHWSNVPLVVETDCAKLLQLIQSRDVDRSRYTYRVSEIRMILAHERNISLAKISRHANAASHTLAFMGRVQQRTACWLRNFPEEIASIGKSECNHLV